MVTLSHTKRFFAVLIVGLCCLIAAGYLYLRNKSIRFIDRSDLTAIEVASIERPTTIEELRKLVTGTKKTLSIAGARWSQGGQTAYPGAIVLDMSALSRIIDLDVGRKLVTVEAGATWRSILEYLDPYDLSVKVMQSFDDFSVGGSLSVNVHARDMHYGSLLSTVESITLLLADGSMVQASRSENSDLFFAAVGGYGLMGVIVTATLSLTDNVRLERLVSPVDPVQYPGVFSQLKKDTTVVFQNADIFPMSFNEAVSITWRKSTHPLTIQARLQSDPINYAPKRTLEVLIRRLPFLHKVRSLVSKFSHVKKEVVLRNYEMSYSIKQLAMSLHYPTTMTLQEYFVPVERYQEALAALTEVLNKHQVNVLNLSIRYVPKDSEALLSYAPEDSFAFVLYINVRNSEAGKKKLCRWTQEVIDKILALDGTYYLPYVICATPEQFHRVYKNTQRFRELKDTYDPGRRFKNMLWKAYFE